MRKVFAAVLMIVALFAGCAPQETADVTAATEPSAAATSAVTGSDCQDGSGAKGQADLEMQDFQFAPPCLIMSKSQGLRLHNEGTVEHNFSVKGFEGLDVDVEPGEENNTEATGLKAGTYEFFCKYHKDSKGMKGQLKLK